MTINIRNARKQQTLVVLARQICHWTRYEGRSQVHSVLTSSALSRSGPS